MLRRQTLLRAVQQSQAAPRPPVRSLQAQSQRRRRPNRSPQRRRSLHQLVLRRRSQGQRLLRPSLRVAPVRPSPLQFRGHVLDRVSLAPATTRLLRSRAWDARAQVSVKAAEARVANAAVAVAEEPVVPVAPVRQAHLVRAHLAPVRLAPELPLPQAAPVVVPAVPVAEHPVAADPHSPVAVAAVAAVRQVLSVAVAARRNPVSRDARSDLNSRCARPRR